MFKVAVCDDSESICEQISGMAFGYYANPAEQVDMETFCSGTELCEFIRNVHTFDLIFLDIEMNGLNGVAVGRILREEMSDYITKIVYISSKTSYYHELFDVQPLKFLQKPLETEKVLSVINLAIKMMDSENTMFAYKYDNGINRIPIKDILYFSSVGRQIGITTAKETVFFYGKMTDISAQLLKQKFVQPHRSYLVNLNYVKTVSNDAITMVNGQRIPLSRAKSKEILNIIMEEDEQ